MVLEYALHLKLVGRFTASTCSTVLLGRIACSSTKRNCSTCRSCTDPSPASCMAAILFPIRLRILSCRNLRSLPRWNMTFCRPITFFKGCPRNRIAGLCFVTQWSALRYWNRKLCMYRSSSVPSVRLFISAEIACFKVLIKFSAKPLDFGYRGALYKRITFREDSHVFNFFSVKLVPLSLTIAWGIPSREKYDRRHLSVKLRLLFSS